eukprot:5176874-Alexandrium_andersonii.AAC.1
MAPRQAARPRRSGLARPRRGMAGRWPLPRSLARSAGLVSSAQSICLSGAPRCSWLSGRWAILRPRPRLRLRASGPSLGFPAQ